MKNKVLLAFGFLALVVIASVVYYWSTLRSEQTIEALNSTPATSDSAPTVEPASESETFASKTERGYIVTVSAKQIAVDYIDTLTGTEAFAVAKEDGVCKQDSEFEHCFPGVAIYDRNVNPKLRTFSLASDVVITSHADGQLSIEQLKSYEADKEPDGYYGVPFDLTFNDQGEVLTITEVFRP